MTAALLAALAALIFTAGIHTGRVIERDATLDGTPALRSLRRRGERR